METQPGTQQALQDLKQDLFRLRDEIKLKIHLGTMELRERWNQLRVELEQYTNSFTEASHDVLQELRQDFFNLKESLSRHINEFRSTDASDEVKFAGRDEDRDEYEDDETDEYVIKERRMNENRGVVQKDEDGE